MEMEMSASMTSIPNDVIVEILLRLPAKTLLRWRWACKYWFALMSRDPSFAKMHLVVHQSTTIHEEIFSISEPYVLISRKSLWGSDAYFQSYLNYNVTTNRVRDTVVSSQVMTPIMNKFYPNLNISLLGSCNGLILLGQPLSRKFCIWNPCTKEYIMLPIPLKIGNVLYATRIDYGFGYDGGTDDYKVIRSVYYKIRNDDPDPQRYSNVQVYSLGTNSWRSIGPNPYKLCRAKGVFLNGGLYWRDVPGGNIISFDLGKEKYRRVSKKPVHISIQWHNAILQVFEGSLCVLLDIDILKRVEMWVMKDYGMNGNNNNNEESFWTKLLTFPNSNFPSFGKPLRYTKTGEMLMVKNMINLVSYDPKRNKNKTLYRIIEEGSHLEVVCAESLVSLNSSTYTGDEAYALKAWRNKFCISKLEIIQYPVLFIFGLSFVHSVLN